MDAVLDVILGGVVDGDGCDAIAEAKDSAFEAPVNSPADSDVVESVFSSDVDGDVNIDAGKKSLVPSVRRPAYGRSSSHSRLCDWEPASADGDLLLLVPISYTCS